MGFVNEKISKEDRVKYRLDELEKKYSGSKIEWAIDYEREMFLIKDWEGHDMGVDTHISVWLFYKMGRIISFTKEIIDYKKVADGYYASTQKITDIQISEALLIFKAEILDNIIEAMHVYKEVGIFSKMTKYDLTVDLSEVK